MASARSRGARIRSNVFAYANLTPYVFFVLFPFYFMIVTSFKSNAELYNLKSIPFWIQSGMIMDHYALLFQKTDFVTWMKNSLLVAVVATTISVIISILAGYSLARLRFRGAAAFGTAIKPASTVMAKKGRPRQTLTAMTAVIAYADCPSQLGPGALMRCRLMAVQLTTL